MEVQEDLTMEVQPMLIMDQSTKELRNKKGVVGKSIVEKLSNRRRNLGERVRNDEEVSWIIFSYRYEFKFR
jgi:hypothetical protein